MKRQIEIKTGFKVKSTIIKDGEGSLIADKKKAADEFKDMLDKMLNQPSQVDTKEHISTVYMLYATFIIYLFLFLFLCLFVMKNVLRND